MRFTSDVPEIEGWYCIEFDGDRDPVVAPIYLDGDEWVCEESHEPRPWTEYWVKELGCNRSQYPFKRTDQGLAISGVGPATYVFSAIPSTQLWTHRQMAQAFLDDARAASAGDDERAKRQEIIFSVCFSESFLVEWAMKALRNDWGEVARLLYPERTLSDGRRVDVLEGVNERWKNAPRRIAENHPDALVGEANNDGQEYQEFKELVDYRNLLVHGGGALPERVNEDSQNPLSPNKNLIGDIPHGWAASVAMAVAAKLCRETGVEGFPWLQWEGE
jgi:hypothetical protein